MCGCADRWAACRMVLVTPNFNLSYLEGSGVGPATLAAVGVGGVLAVAVLEAQGLADELEARVHRLVPRGAGLWSRRAGHRTQSQGCEHRQFMDFRAVKWEALLHSDTYVGVAAEGGGVQRTLSAAQRHLQASHPSPQAGAEKSGYVSPYVQPFLLLRARTAVYNLPLLGTITNEPT